MNKNFRRASIGMGISGILFIAGALPSFLLSKTPEEGWTLFVSGVIFLVVAVAFWWMGRKTYPEG
jgi:hypothetical protein